MKILFRCDSNAAIGTGHVMRCLALAQAAKDEGWDALFAMWQGDGTEERVRQEGFEIHVMVSGDARETLEIAKKYKSDWIVVDGYQFDSCYQKALKDAGLNLFFIDDYGHSDHYYADIVLNQNVYASEDFYLSREPRTTLLLGTKYVLLREEFRVSSSLPRRGRVRERGSDTKNILITFGGLGNKKLSTNLQNTLDAKGYTVRVAAGVTNMSDLMQWADIAIAAGGITTYELARMGVPMILVITADNQQRVVDGAVQAGFARSLGWYTDVNDADITDALHGLLENEEERLRLSRRGQELVDGKGVERVLEAMRMSSPVCQ